MTRDRDQRGCGCIAGLLTVVLAAARAWRRAGAAGAGESSRRRAAAAAVSAPISPAGTRRSRATIRAAALWYEEALAADPQLAGTDQPHLPDGGREAAISTRRCRSPQKVLDLDRLRRASPVWCCCVDRVKAGDNAGALARAEALPDDGVHRYAGPLALAWTRMAVGRPRRRRCGAASSSTSSTASRR